MEYTYKKDEKIADFQRFLTFDTDIIYGGVPLRHQSHYATSPITPPATLDQQNIKEIVW